ncbi:MAG: hypothetical protein ACRDRU_09935 [Pseudonocardiaceae bacterium]
MSDALSFTEIVGQHVELLPARTVLSMFTRDTNSGNDPAAGLVKVVTGLISPSTPGAAGESGPVSS